MNKATKVLAVAAGLALLLILLVSAALAYSGRDITLLQDRVVHLSVNGYVVEIPMKEDGATFDVPSLTTETENEFVLMNDAGASIEVNKAKLQTNKKAKVTVKKIDSNEVLEMVVTNGKDTRTVYLRTLSKQLPEMLATGQSPSEGNFYVTDTEKAAMYKLDLNGNVSWYVALTPEQADGKIFTDFRQHKLENGDTRYSYHIVDPDVTTMGLGDYYPGTRVILDEKYKEVKRSGARISLLDPNEKARDEEVMGDPIDGHSFVLLGDKNWITESYSLESVDNIPAELKPGAMGSKVVAAVIQEVKDGKPVFTWKSTDYPELYSLSVKGNDFSGSNTTPQDYLHINAMVIDPSDNNLIVSFQNANTIIKIDRADGKILWKLSGKGDEFGLADNQKTTSIADLSLADDGSLVVFDNSAATGKARVLKYKLDEGTKKVADFKEFSMEGYTAAQNGSAQKVDPNKETYLIGWGVNAAGQPAITEMNFTDNKKQLEIIFPNGEHTFKVKKFDQVAQ